MIAKTISERAARPFVLLRTPLRAARWAIGLGPFLAIACAAPARNVTRLSLQEPSEPAQTRERAATPDATTQQPERVLAGPVLQRSAFVAAVLQRNPTLEAARCGWRAALAKQQQAGALEDPMLELGIAPLSVGSSAAPFGYEASLSQKLPWFGKRGFDRAASAAEAEAVKNDYESTKRELALAAVALYQQYFIAARALEINAAHVELVQAMRQAAAAQFASGRGSAQDVLQAEAELAHMEHDAVVLRAARRLLQAQMNELLHNAPALALPPPPAQLPAPPEPDADAARLQESAVHDRPEIAALEQRTKAQQARSRRAELESYPDLTLSTSYSSMWDTPAQRWMIGLGLHLPLQTAPRQGAVDEARALGSQWEQQAAGLRDTARTQVFVSLEQLAESKHVLQLFETRLLPLAKARIEAARAGFTASQNPFVAVVDAERSLRGLELEYQKARSEQVQRRAELDRALGRIPALDWKEGNP